MSRKITLTVLSAAALTAGCGRPPPAPAPVMVPEPPDPNWYGPDGRPIEEGWGFDDDGAVVPLAHPHDRHGRPWVWTPAGDLVPPPPLLVAAATAGAVAGTTHRTYSSGGGWLWGRPGYRSFGGSASPSPSRSASPSPAPSSVSRGGFGSTSAGISAGS